ncbi:DUF4249 domain-containing protein [Dyadobacter chenhuakuii]|uniref:DUF4249 domain-containing protein n=1 Tax=Dyadobacter chenhuakuii TaxID=2909339 RepID=A0A9X1QEA6_9BACT|nr:DUF4249 domain-containing protein [Dyadobacter chenhuakuii]MCF2498797.1 DUF4249 domain-containing protein [Dyadobacter chenhuakuii]MCF2516487.1 DUF4249 domain-containing protein [Dyadobacter sp. CY351]
MDLIKGNEKVLVVESEFNNLNTGNFVRLTWTRNVQEKEVLPVDHALIVVSSDSGETDTLKKENDDNNNFDGYYFSDRLKCEPNRTYTLKIDVDGRMYEATATTPRPPKIDSLRLGFVKYEIGKSDGVMPFIYFREPSAEKNYYMGKLCPDGYFSRRNPCPVMTWYANRAVLLLDDKYLAGYVNGININLPDDPKRKYIPSLFGDYLAILYSITPESYEYFQSLMEALKSDGGVYSPSPANHPTNIKSKHKVVGFFHVASLDSFPFFAPLR